MKFEWERLEGDSTCDGGHQTTRAKVFGGWIVKHLCWCNENQVQSEAMVFVPDHLYQWTIEK